MRKKTQLLDPVVGEWYMRENEGLFSHLKELQREQCPRENQALVRVKGKETILERKRK